MRYFFLVPAIATLAAAQIIATCARDNCLRAVIASNGKPGPSQASADCSSFLRATVTPATVTSTTVSFATVTAAPVTVTSTTTGAVTVSQFTATTITVIPQVPVRARNPAQQADNGPSDHRITGFAPIAARQKTVSPASIPAYASPCSGAARYSSACSCIGVTRTTSTVAAPRTTTTSISTVTVTPTVLQTQTQTQTLTTTVVTTATATACTGSSFYLQAQDSDVNGQYVVLPGTNDETITSFTADKSAAAVFNIDGSGRLLNNGLRANTDNNSPVTIFFDIPGSFAGTTDLTCTRDGTSFNCVGYNAATMFQLCPQDCTANSEICGGVSLGTTVDSRCQPISFSAVCAQ